MATLDDLKRLESSSYPGYIRLVNLLNLMGKSHTWLMRRRRNGLPVPRVKKINMRVHLVKIEDAQKFMSRPDVQT